MLDGVRKHIWALNFFIMSLRRLGPEEWKGVCPADSGCRHVTVHIIGVAC